MQKRCAGLPVFALALVFTPAALAQEAGPTFYRDVAPILQERCQSCHRAGEIGPMPLGTYAEVRPFARAIKNAVDFAVSGFTALGVDPELIEAYPHMHVRGKSMKLSALYPGGKKEELLSVPRYDFNWQLTYEMTEPKRIPKGTIFRADGTFNNSASNRFNPDPSKEVRWGDQSWDEMLVGFFQIAVPAGTDPQTILLRR